MQQPSMTRLILYTFFFSEYFSLYRLIVVKFYFTGKSIWQLVLEQFDDLLVKILLLAAIISFVSNRDLLLHVLFTKEYIIF